MVRQSPPAPVRVAVVILVVLSSLFLVLFVLDVAGGLNDTSTGPDAGGTQVANRAGLLVLGLFGLYIAVLVRRGRRGGRVLAYLVAVGFLCSGVSLTHLPSPYNVVSVVPLLAGLAVLALLTLPAPSRDWFNPELWTGTR